MEINTLELRNEARLITFESSVRFSEYKQNVINRLRLNYKAK
jgi:hypothetical protein